MVLLTTVLTFNVRKYVKEAMMDMAGLVLAMGLTLIGWSVWRIRHE